jgi:hypothetical protein
VSVPLPHSTDELECGGSFLLSGPVPRPEANRVPLRGDLAHIGLAGRYFVPHYAVPQPWLVGPGGAPLLAAPEAGAETLHPLAAGDTFDVLEISGAWAWGCVSLEGPVGYVALDRLAKPV